VLEYDAERVVGLEEVIEVNDARVTRSCSQCVGVLLYHAYHALTGTFPIDGDTTQVLRNKQLFASPSTEALAGNDPLDLVNLCDRLLAVDPAQRPDADEILDALRADADQLRVTSTDGIFVGRHAELLELRRAYESAREGKPSVVCVFGESGVGKTALIEQFFSQTQGDDVLRLRSRCYAREWVPFKAFDECIDTLMRIVRSRPQLRSREWNKACAEAARVFPQLRELTGWDPDVESRGADAA
jgi:eukaryotic-like serine/threonine-protein kinase